jgi:hypothetical protein
VLQCVRDQIAHRAPEECRVGVQRRLAAAAQRDALLGGDGVEDGAQGIELRAGIHGLARERNLGPLGAGQEEQVRGHAGQPVVLFQARRQHAAVLRLRARLRERHLRLAHEVAHRRTQFMREVCREAAQTLKGSFEAAQHGVEGAGKGRQLRRPPRRTDALAEPRGASFEARAVMSR